MKVMIVVSGETEAWFWSVFRNGNRSIINELDCAQSAERES